MTPEMLELARRNQAEAGVENAEFLQGTIEDIPLPDATVDVIISNCVINLAADKDPVLREAFRVLAPGGRFAVSDIVVLRPLPEIARRAMRLWTGCVAGALLDTEYVAKLTAAGFVDATVEVTRGYTRQDLLDLAADLRPEDIPPTSTWTPSSRPWTAPSPAPSSGPPSPDARRRTRWAAAAGHRDAARHPPAGCTCQRAKE